MSTSIRVVSGTFLLLLSTSCSSEADASGDKLAKVAFRNALNKPPTDWPGPVFELSHDYPSQLPSGDVKQNAPWLARDVSFDQAPTWSDGWDDYMNDLLAYIRDGQDVQLDDKAGWSAEVDGATRWFHVPWMAYNDLVGREFVHGLTNERTAHISDLLGPTALSASSGKQPTEFETWAFGVYNQYGGYAIGQVIPSSGVPQTTSGSGSAPRPVGLPFPEGTLVTKLLFTTATEDEVSFLKGSPSWKANRHVKLHKKPRKPAPVQLVQIDVAVVDHRSPTGWVYGTFAYNGTLSGATIWDRLSPLGLQWGSDPQTFPAVTQESSVPATQSVLAPIDIYEHYGPEGRLAGPVDNGMSSCMSCHASSFAAPVGTIGEMGQNTPPSFGFTGMGTTFNKENDYYFNNIKFPEPYADPKYAGTVPLDTSLQLWVAFTQYATYLSKHAR